MRYLFVPLLGILNFNHLIQMVLAMFIHYKITEFFPLWLISILGILIRYFETMQISYFSSIFHPLVSVVNADSFLK